MPGHRPVSRQIPYQLPYFRFGGLPSSGRVGSQRIGSGSRLDRPAFGQKRGIEIEIGFLQPGMLLLPDQVGQDIDPLHARPAHLKTGYQRHADRHDDDDQRDPKSAARIIALLVHVLRICTGAKLINYIGQNTLPAAVSETNGTERRNEKACKRRSIRRKVPVPPHTRNNKAGRSDRSAGFPVSRHCEFSAFRRFSFSVPAGIRCSPLYLIRWSSGTNSFSPDTFR